MKSLAAIIATLSLFPLISMASPTETISITGKKAEALTLALLNSGFNGEVKAGVRTLEVDSLVLVKGIAQHECDDLDNVSCGFNQPASIHTAKQAGKDIEAQESVQLAEALAKIVDPFLASKKINIADSGMGKTYSDYGNISCSWKVLNRTSFPIVNARCVLQVPNNGN